MLTADLDTIIGIHKKTAVRSFQVYKQEVQDPLYIAGIWFLGDFDESYIVPYPQIFQPTSSYSFT